MAGTQLTVFTKPWRMPVDRLAAHVASLGFDGVELPVRPGYPVDPDNAATALPRAARVMAEHGLAIASIAGPPTEAAAEACAAAGVPVIRICVNVRTGETYPEAESRLQREFEALVPALDRCGVTLGVQNHCGRSVCHASGLRALLAPFDPRHVAAVWDAAHNALQGEEPELALDPVWPHLCMVNLKNAHWQRVHRPDAETAAWRVHWTSGRLGLADWPRVARELKRRGYAGPVCLTAEYSEGEAVDRLAAEDLAFARRLFDPLSVT